MSNAKSFQNKYGIMISDTSEILKKNVLLRVHLNKHPAFDNSKSKFGPTMSFNQNSEEMTVISLEIPREFLWEGY